MLIRINWNIFIEELRKCIQIYSEKKSREEQICWMQKTSTTVAAIACSVYLVRIIFTFNDLFELIPVNAIDSQDSRYNVRYYLVASAIDFQILLCNKEETQNWFWLIRIGILFTLCTQHNNRFSLIFSKTQMNKVSRWMGRFYALTFFFCGFGWPPSRNPLRKRRRTTFK